MATLPAVEQYEAFEARRNAVFFLAVYAVHTRTPEEVAAAVGRAAHDVYLMDELFHALFGMYPNEAAPLVYGEQ